MKEKYIKLLSEILLAISIGILLSIFILILYRTIHFTIYSISFFLSLVIIASGVYCLKFLKKYHLSLEIVELVGVVISFLITALYAHTISLSIETEKELFKMMFSFHTFLLFVTVICLYFFRKKEK